MDRLPFLQKLTGWKRAGLYALGAFLLLAVMAAGSLVIIPVVSPSGGAQVADLLRAALGPDAVASLETVSFRIQDAANRRLVVVTGDKPGITLGGQSGSLNTNSRSAPSLLTLQSSPNVAAGGNVVTAPPQIGWQPYGPSVNGGPVLSRALLTLDPQRPFAAIALVRIDLSQLQLHMMPGFLEPSSSPNVSKAVPNPGLTPSADLGRLVAGFNGGFKAVNGHYGMMVNGVTLLPPVPGIATIAVYKDGRVRIGAWGTDIQPAADLVAYRQNCPPIIQAGSIDPQVAVDNRAVWGDTIGNKEITWRTGLGLSQDGRYLIYAVGNATTVSTLAQALQQAGAYNAMQLDINRHYAHFVTYPVGTNGSRSAVQLLDQMENVPNLYLVAHSRDYFYLTTN